ncbi:Type I restriction-modification system, S subunit [Moritella viscosa]|uniref:restriction endonuclease subunit S n=1 Tax=Moritella viscosa TaxID=80854 RepID=UPI00091530CB|nr:restriction endonuclease subunit S [Moritella viscosa]SHO19431.1 Type I restriction-modification system, S subunit [Moritella viscosa]
MSNLIPDGWNYQPLSSLAEIDKGSLKGSTDPAYQFKYIDIASVSTGQICLPTEYISFGEAPSRARKKIRCGDVLMSTVRPNLKSFAYFDTEGDNFVASTGFSVIRATGGNDGRFIFNSILADDITRQIEALVVGSNYPAINSSDVKNLEILTPTKPEQQKIAAILTSVDDVIEKTQAQIDKLKDLKTGMMKDLLTRGVGVDGKPHTEFKDSPVGRIPKGWGVLPLKSVVQPIIDCEHKTAPYVDKSDFMVVRTSNVKNGELVLNDMKYTHESGYTEWTKRAIPSIGDVLFTREAPAGESCLVPEGVKVCMGQRMVLLRPNLDVITPHFFSLFLISEAASQTIYELSIGTTVSRINIEDIKRIPCIVPSLNEQKQISDVIQSIQNSILKKQKKLKSQVNAKQALMQDLLTGKVRVKVDS